MSAETVDLAKTRQVEPAAAAPATASPRPSAAASSVIFTANGSPPKPLHDAEADSTLANSASTASLNSTQQQNPNPQLMALRKIDALSAKLQSEGKLLESLQCLEKSLILRGHIFGLDSVEVLRACKTVGELCNYLSMSFLQQDLFDVTLELLKKAEVLTERHKAVRAVTYNNMVRRTVEHSCQKCDCTETRRADTLLLRVLSPSCRDRPATIASAASFAQP